MWRSRAILNATAQACPWNNHDLLLLHETSHSHMDKQIPDDEFKWFGEGFDGFPKRLPDDCVEYIIFVIDSTLQNTSTLRTGLSEIHRAANQLKKKLLKEYIWQRDAFDLTIQPRIDQPVEDASKTSRLNGLPHLKGRTNFGDSIADEWLIVYLLLELSKQFPVSWIRVYDTDGEFLLIEAGKVLPKWLNPEIAENRVWINNGHLKLIPINETSINENLELSSALSFIKQSPEKLIVEPSIEKEAFHRLTEYPSVISASLHHAVIPIPRRLAYILNRNPAYISPAVEAFYLRDPISLKPLGTKDISTLNLPPEDFVSVSVKFTKVGYAQLRGQMFDTPPSWTGFIPRLRDEKAEVGLKLTCGFEMLLVDPQNQDNRIVREIKLLLEDLESSEEDLPSDAEVASWLKTQDDEKWLDIDFKDFENELAGKAGNDQTSGANDLNDGNAQESLRKMVSRFRNFLDDDNAAGDGVGDVDSEDESDTSSTTTDAEKSEGRSDADDAEFEQAMKEAQAMPSSHIEQSGLLEEARKLALQDAENGIDIDEDEEVQKVMDLIEKELKGHKAPNVNGSKGKNTEATTSTTSKGVVQKPLFGPEKPPHMQSKGKMAATADEEDSSDGDIGPGDGELSSDDEGFNDVDLGLARNMLEAFKGQAGTAGPAGNLMRALGVKMPRDEGEDE